MFQQALYLIATISILMFAGSCAVSKDPQATKFRLLQKGKLKDDTSYVYSLPYAINTKEMVVQGYFSRFTHKNRAAIDFKMKRGTPIHAATDGVVTQAGWAGGYGQMVRLAHAGGDCLELNTAAARAPPVLCFAPLRKRASQLSAASTRPMASGGAHA